MTMIAHAESSQHLRHGYVDLPWSTSQETEPTPTSAEIQRAVTGCGWHRSPSTSRRNVRAARNNTHIDEILRGSNLEITVRSSFNQVEYHTGFADVDNVIDGVLSQRSAGRSNKRQS